MHLDENVTEDSLLKYPLADYAGKYWVEHACFEGVAENAEGMKELFDGSKPHLAIWLWIYDPIWTPYRRAESPAPPQRTPLHYAAFCGLHTVVKFLAIEHSQNVVSPGVNNESTPLHLASRGGHVEVARFLVEHEADVTARDHLGGTPLHQASTFGHIDLARFLVEHGADVTARDGDGATPLHQASTFGCVGLARFLVEHGADVIARDGDGGTPLHRASSQGHVDLARFLVEHGADVTAQDGGGGTPCRKV